MKCPTCREKMEYQKDIKDYFCENCDLSLKDIQKMEAKDEDKELDKEEGKSKEEEQPDSFSQPDVATVKGIMFMMIGSLILILTPILQAVCELFSIIGLFLLIMGFFMVYQDRKNQSREHEIYMKYALFFFIAWLVVYLSINIISIMVGNDITNEIQNFDEDQVITRNIIKDYLEDIKIITIFSFPTITLLACFRFLTIKAIIQKNLRKVLGISLALLIISGFCSMIVTIEFYDTTIKNLEDTTREEFINLDFNTTENDENTNQNMMFYLLIFLNTSAEAIMLLCYYWAWRNKKDQIPIP
jgi:hypothetical protein